MPNVLEISDIHTYYGDSYVLQGASLNVGSGQVVALMGRNGVGKTTTIRSIVGFSPPKRGTITFKDVDITRMATHRIAKEGISLVPQGRRIFPSLTVAEHLRVFKRGGGEGAGEHGWDLDRILALFPALEQRMKQRGSSLSGGEQQMLAIARALLTNPELLLMDEPSEGLSPLAVQQVVEVIEHLRKAAGLPMLLVEQNLSMALNLADRIYVMNKGAIVFEGPAEELASSQEVQRTYLGL
jgi:branched-chain amino acid transport system ATP-binding protein